MLIIIAIASAVIAIDGPSPVIATVVHSINRLDLVAATFAATH